MLPVFFDHMLKVGFQHKTRGLVIERSAGSILRYSQRIPLDRVKRPGRCRIRVMVYCQDR